MLSIHGAVGRGFNPFPAPYTKPSRDSEVCYWFVSAGSVYGSPARVGGGLALSTQDPAAALMLPGEGTLVHPALPRVLVLSAEHVFVHLLCVLLCRSLFLSK